MQALAYAQGTDIHVAPGQEKYLPHEAWHVVQQKQGRVQPTTQMKGGVNVNDDKELEKEADVMGSKASATTNDPTVLRKAKNNPSIVQKGGGMSKSAESESYARVNLLNKSGENPMGHSSLDIVHDGKVTHIDTGLSQSDYARVTQDPIKAMQGKTGAKFTVAVSEGDAISKSTSSVKIELAPEKAEAIIEKAKKIDGRTEAWNANRNCTTPVKELLGMRQGRIFNSPSGTLVQAYVKRYPKAVGFLAATGGLAAYFAFSKYSRDKKDE